MDTITCKYLDSSGVVHSKTLGVVIVKGFDAPDKIEFVPQVVYDYADGRLRTQFRGFRRTPHIEGAITNDATVFQFLLLWQNANTKSISYQGFAILAEEVGFVPLDEKGFEIEWNQDYALAKKFILDIVESGIHSAFPIPIPITTDDIVYIAKKVKITGTESSPEIFTTNSGKLQYNYGVTPFPAISLLTYNVSVDIDGTPYQDCHFFIVSDVSQSGENITFSVARSHAGKPSGDGFYYADIKIMLQQIS